MLLIRTVGVDTIDVLLNLLLGYAVFEAYDEGFELINLVCL